MDDYKNYIVIGNKYNGLGESADPDSWDSVKYNFNTEDEVKDFIDRISLFLFNLKAIYKVEELDINNFIH